MTLNCAFLKSFYTKIYCLNKLQMIINNDYYINISKYFTLNNLWILRDQLLSLRNVCYQLLYQIPNFLVISIYVYAQVIKNPTLNFKTLISKYHRVLTILLAILRFCIYILIRIFFWKYKFVIKSLNKVCQCLLENSENF